MEIVWAGVGFLVGMSLWMPFGVGVRMETKLWSLEGRITTQVAELIRQRDRT